MKKILYFLYTLRCTCLSLGARGAHVKTSSTQRLFFLQLAFALCGIEGIAQAQIAGLKQNTFIPSETSASLNMVHTTGVAGHTAAKDFFEQVIRGRVTDKDGEGLPGVTIVLKGTSTGTNTDIDGKYTLSISEGNGTLIFSYIGYIKQEMPINNRSIIDVKLLDDLKNLEEVVVVGYGQQKKITLTGSVSSVTGAEIRQILQQV